ncbi:MAG: type II toxin-antitoxin system VapC family toxin [Alphaproteobacteria bacterium]|nr:type II toxin-antitoxin system VapC family toxin [Alphaproteobacteria bacterium]
MTVLDGSALIAFIRGEPGAEKVAERLDGALMSAANLAEVLTKATEWARDPAEVLAEIRHLPIVVVPVSAKHALTAALLRPLTRSAGLSLGDRFCLALALSTGRPAMCAEAAWVGLPHNVEIELIR